MYCCLRNIDNVIKMFVMKNYARDIAVLSLFNRRIIIIFRLRNYKNYNNLFLCSSNGNNLQIQRVSNFEMNLFGIFFYTSKRHEFSLFLHENN